MDKKKLEQRLTALKGHIGFYYKNLVTGETYQYHSEDAFEAASLPKLALLLEVLKLAQEGVLHLTDKVKVKDGDKVGGCGALKSFPGDLEVDIETLCRLMITISDNTATNALLRLVGSNVSDAIWKRWDYPRHASNAVILTMRRRQEGSPTMCARARLVCCWSRSIEEASAVKQYRRMRKRSSCCSRSATKSRATSAEAKKSPTRPERAAK